jgi:hypothetical protein
MKYAQAAALVLVAGLVFVELASAGKLMLAIAEGIVVPVAVVGEWRWQATHRDGNPEIAALRMAAIVIVALLGIPGAGGSP